MALVSQNGDWAAQEVQSVLSGIQEENIGMFAYILTKNKKGVKL